MAGAQVAGTGAAREVVAWRAVFVLEDASFGKVRESVFGVCQFTERERKSLHRELTIEIIRAAGSVYSIKHGTIRPSVTERARSSCHVLHNLMWPVTMNILRYKQRADQEILSGQLDEGVAVKNQKKKSDKIRI